MDEASQESANALKVAIWLSAGWTYTIYDVKHLYFVRHGESKLNVSGHFAGHTETPLTELGIKQARKAGKQAKKLNIDLIVSSPLSRAYDTAKIIAEEIGHVRAKIVVTPLLKERFYGSAEATPYSREPGHLESFEGFETEEELISRAEKIIKFVEKHKGENVLLVSHGGIGRRLRQKLVPKYDHLERIPNAEIVQWL